MRSITKLSRKKGLISRIRIGLNVMKAIKTGSKHIEINLNDEGSKIDYD